MDWLAIYSIPNQLRFGNCANRILKPKLVQYNVAFPPGECLCYYIIPSYRPHMQAQKGRYNIAQGIALHDYVCIITILRLFICSEKCFITNFK
jgi:hypothetical protein